MLHSTPMSYSQLFAVYVDERKPFPVMRDSITVILTQLNNIHIDFVICINFSLVADSRQ